MNTLAWQAYEADLRRLRRRAWFWRGVALVAVLVALACIVAGAWMMKGWKV